MPDNNKISSLLERLVKDILSIKDARSRTTILAERLSRQDVETVVLLLEHICVMAERKRPGFQEVFLSLIDIPAVASIMGNDMLSDVYLASKRMGMERVTRLLINPPPKKQRHGDYDFVEGQVRDDISLGEKRSLAKGMNKDKVERLIYDPDPMVIRNILNNPKMTERDILKIASKRPTEKGVLLEIFNHKKWIERYSVKKALAKNPYTPTGVALRLLNLLMIQDLRDISCDRTLHDEIREAARVLVEKRGD